MGRFINSDDRVVDDGNMFSYCNNNPVNMTDHDGHWPKWLKRAVALAIVIVVVVAVVAISVATVGVGTTMIAAGIGAIAGVGGKYIEDVTYNKAKGKKGLSAWRPSSSLEDYTASGLTGAIMGMASAINPTAGLAGKNALDALLKPYLKQNIELASGARDDFDSPRYIKDSVIRFGSSFLKAKGPLECG